MTQTQTPAASSGAQPKKLGLFAALAFAVGTMIGGGVFALSGTVIDQSGTGAIAGYVIAGVMMLFSALCFAAVSARAPEGATGYEPIAKYLSPVWRFLAMWAFLIMGIASIAFVLVSFGSYLMYFFPKGETGNAMYWSIGAAVLLVLLNFGPAALVGKAETVMVVFKVTILMVMIVFGLIAFVPDRLAEAHGSMSGSASILHAAAILFTAYTGFNVVTNMSGQIKNPKKNVPRAIILSLVIVAVIYVLVAIALIMSKVGHFGNAGLAEAAHNLGNPFGIGVFLGALVAIAACVSTLSGGNANLLASAELLVGMAANGDIPSRIGKLTSKGTPVTAVLIIGVVAIVLMVSGAFETIVVISNVATVIAMVIVNLTAARMALKKWPGAGMKLPLGITIPVLGILGALSNLAQYEWWQNLVGVALVAAGLLLYVNRKHSDKHTVAHIHAHLAANNTPLRRVFRRGPALVIHERHSADSASTPAAPAPAAAPTQKGTEHD